MEKLVAIVRKAPSTRDYSDDDIIDRLSSKYTVVLLISFAVLVSINQYVRNPITCFAPSQFSGNHVKYATNLCWVKNTYFLPWNTTAPRVNSPVRRQTINYYQWIPFILLGQAFLFYLPSIIWHSLNQSSGVDADNILAAAHTFSMTDKVETRDRTMKMLIQQIHRFLGHREKNHIDCCNCDLKSFLNVTCCGMCKKRFGSYLFMIFILSKIFYITNSIGQLWLLGVIFSFKYYSFGADVLNRLIEKRESSEEVYVAFPRVTICEFHVRGQDMVNTHPHSLQCVLPINLYNEKIYIFIWYWLAAIAILSVLSLFVWLIRLLPYDRINFIMNHISEDEDLNKQNSIDDDEKRNSFDSDSIDGRESIRQSKFRMLKEKLNKNNNKLELKLMNNPNSMNNRKEELNEKRISEVKKNYLEKLSNSKNSNHKVMRNSKQESIKEFSKFYLKRDGELLLRLIAHNTDHITTSDITNALWKQWLENRQNKINERTH